MKNDRSKVVAALLALFFGSFGAHRFYLGNTMYGMFYILFSWTLVPAIVSFFDFLVLLGHSPDYFDRKYNKHLFDASGVRK